MKNIIIILVMTISLSSFAQSACACEEFFGSCKVQCPQGTLAKCDGTWYGSCKCSCEELVLTPAPIGAESSFNIDLNDVEKMKTIFEETNNKNLKELESLIAELQNKSKNDVFSTNDDIVYNNYFYKLESLFNSLNLSNKKKLVNLIEA